MYSYYLLSSLGVNVPFKQGITILQIVRRMGGGARRWADARVRARLLQVQFFAMLHVGISSLLVECSFPRWMSIAMALYMVSLIILFANFYIQSYLKPKQPKTKVAGKSD